MFSSATEKKQKYVVFKPIVIASPSGSLSMGHDSHRLWDATWRRGPVIAKYNRDISKIVGLFDRKVLKILTNFVFSLRCLNRLRLSNIYNSFYRLTRNDNISYSKNIIHLLRE